MNQDLIKDFFSLFCIPLQNEVFLNIFRNFPSINAVCCIKVTHIYE